jgi:hypothetical protein
MRITSITLPLLGLITVLTTFTVSAEDYYKWVDDQGVTHYGERPPKNTTASKGKTQTGHSTHTPYVVTQDTEASATTATNTENQKDPERCKAAKSNLDIINTSARIKVKGDDGEFSYLSPDEIAKRKKDAQQAVKESC